MLSWQHLSFLPTIPRDFWVGLSSDRRLVLGIIVYRKIYQLFLHWSLKFLIKLSYLIFLSSVHSRFKYRALIAKKHKSIGFSKWFHQTFPITGILLSMFSRRLILQQILRSPSMIYTYELHFTITHSLFKSKSQMCSKLHRISWKKMQWIYI